MTSLLELMFPKKPEQRDTVAYLHWDGQVQVVDIDRITCQYNGPRGHEITIDGILQRKLQKR